MDKKTNSKIKTKKTSTKISNSKVKTVNAIATTKKPTVKSKSIIQEKPAKKLKLEIKNKKLFIIIGAVVFLIILLLCIFKGSDSPLGSSKSLTIEYKNAKVIELSKVKNGTVYKNTIVVTNDYDKDIKYSIKWKGVKNTFEEQNKLLYKLDTHDSDALYIGSSQVPIADFSLSNNIVIKSKTKHTYYIYISFKGNPVKEKKSTFEGILEIKEIK